MSTVFHFIREKLIKGEITASTVSQIDDHLARIQEIWPEITLETTVFEVPAKLYKGQPIEMPRTMVYWANPASLPPPMPPNFWAKFETVLKENIWGTGEQIERFRADYDPTGNILYVVPVEK